MKKACVLRWGAYGDLIIASPIFKLLKEQGYHVTLNTIKLSEVVNKHNPYIDETVIYAEDTIPIDNLNEYWDEMAKGYDRFINLTGSIENSIVKVEGNEQFLWSKERRHKECNVNFYDNTLKVSGYPDKKGLSGDLHFTRLEEKIAREYRKKYKDKFLIMWSLAGSAIDKIYPYTEIIARAFLAKHPDAMIITVGDEASSLLEWANSPQTKCYSGRWGFRKSMIMTKYVDLVIGSDTGLMHAAGCYDTAKILLMSSNNVENISKYWKNCVNLSADVFCQPCHQLHYTLESCPYDPKLLAPLCMARLKGHSVYNAILDVYKTWKEKRDGFLYGSRKQAVLCG